MAKIYLLNYHKDLSSEALKKVLQLIGVTVIDISIGSKPNISTYVLLSESIINCSDFNYNPKISLLENIAIAGRISCIHMKNRFISLISPHLFTLKDKEIARNKGLDIATDLCSLLRLIAIHPFDLTQNEINDIKETQFESYLKFIHHEIKAKRLDGLLPKIKKCLALAVQTTPLNISIEKIESLCMDEALMYISPFISK